VTPDDFMGEVIATSTAGGARWTPPESAWQRRRRACSGALASMFGYVTDLRSKTQGRAIPHMQFHSYQQVPASIEKEIVARSAANNQTERSGNKQS